MSAQNLQPTAHKRPTVFFLGLAMAALAGCGGGSETAGGASSSSSGAGCNYTDLVPASERSQASVCGIQVSGNYAQADSGLANVIAACQRGDTATADEYYNGTYTTMVSYARSVSEALSCGTSTTPTLPDPSPQTYYNFCVTSRAAYGRVTYTGSCFGPVKQGEGGCGSEVDYISQYDSQSACATAGQSWLNSH